MSEYMPKDYKLCTCSLLSDRGKLIRLTYTDDDGRTWRVENCPKCGGLVKWERA